MAKNIASDIPDYKERQRILYVDKATPERMLEIADRLIEQDRFSEAYDYIERSNDEARIRLFMDDAFSRGDFFNYDRAARRLMLEVPPKTWEALGDIAIRYDLVRYAVEAYRRAGNRNKAREIISANPDFFGPTLEMDRGMHGKFEPEEADEELPEGNEEPEAPAASDQPEVAGELSSGEEDSTSAEPSKDPDQLARDAAAKARKKKWKKKK